MCRTLETFCMHLNIYKSMKIDSNTHTQAKTQTYRHRNRVGNETFSSPERPTGTYGRTDGRTERTQPQTQRVPTGVTGGVIKPLQKQEH